VNDHATHGVTLLDVAARQFRDHLDKQVDLTDALDAHLARATVALKDLEDRTSKVQKQVLQLISPNYSTKERSPFFISPFFLLLFPFFFFLFALSGLAILPSP